MDDDPAAAGGPAREAAYDSVRLDQWLAGRARWDGMPRRGTLRMPGIADLATGALPGTARQPAASSGPIVKPLPRRVLRLRVPRRHALGRHAGQGVRRAERALLRAQPHPHAAR